ncbi:MAG: glycerol-3-phosphate dehydrogenase (NAD(P)+) [Candidatus Tokpelaia sp. JSC085]|nr:MAG: glycerol-3-phosphate dehydrogenase (NAD(P)+) [Candidatus Tokpelaia sp. JSC085]
MKTRKSLTITVLGGGAWGTALSIMAANLQHNVCLYLRDCKNAEIINTKRRNSRYFPEIVLPDTITATADQQDALSIADLVMVVVPAQVLAKALVSFAPFVSTKIPLILCCKGIDSPSGRFMSEIARDIFPKNSIATLSGPGFAADVAKGLPTAVTIAASDERLSINLAYMLSGPLFRCYVSTDVIGVEVGGALKNVMALAAGMVAGQKLGASAQAAIITRGFAELRKIGRKLGGQEETMTGLSVLGDLILTCSSPLSRNYAYGIALGTGKQIDSSLLAEGVATAPVAANLCKKHNIDAPIISTVAAILAGHVSINAAVRTFVTRPLKFED